MEIINTSKQDVEVADNYIEDKAKHKSKLNQVFYEYQLMYLMEHYNLSGNRQMLKTVHNAILGFDLPDKIQKKIRVEIGKYLETQEQNTGEILNTSAEMTNTGFKIPEPTKTKYKYLKEIDSKFKGQTKDELRNEIEFKLHHKKQIKLIHYFDEVNK